MYLLDGSLCSLEAQKITFQNFPFGKTNTLMLFFNLSGGLTAVKKLRKETA